MRFFNEYKTFIKRGNVVDMAVGVIVGGAFTAIVTAMNNSILRPLVNFFPCARGGCRHAQRSAHLSQGGL